ncbi:radical SAM protein [candidate division KSB1 bacterium]
MEHKLEINKWLEQLDDEGKLDNSLAVLNLPDARLCTHGCPGCITKGAKVNLDEKLSSDETKQVIGYFAKHYGTKIITINGRGDPFHPKLKETTLEKIRYAAKKGIRSYVFTAGDNLDEKTCQELFKYRANVMISLFGNKFIDAEFFEGKEYSGKDSMYAENIRRLIESYRTSPNKTEEGITRIGMNYVVSENDLNDESKVRNIKEAADKNGIFLICNTDFNLHDNPEIQQQIEKLASKYSSFNLRHSTAAGNKCRMGAASSATVDYNGKLYKCPYMDGEGDGNFFEMKKEGKLKRILEGYLQNRDYTCVLRKTK